MWIRELYSNSAGLIGILMGCLLDTWDSEAMHGKYQSMKPNYNVQLKSQIVKYLQPLSCPNFYCGFKLSHGQLLGRPQTTAAKWRLQIYQYTNCPTYSAATKWNIQMGLKCALFVALLPRFRQWWDANVRIMNCHFGLDSKFRPYQTLYGLCRVNWYLIFDTWYAFFSKRQKG